MTKVCSHLPQAVSAHACYTVVFVLCTHLMLPLFAHHYSQDCSSICNMYRLLPCASACGMLFTCPAMAEFVLRQLFPGITKLFHIRLNAKGPALRHLFQDITNYACIRHIIMMLIIMVVFCLQVGPIKIFPLYSTLPPQQQQKIFEAVSS